LRKSIGTLPTEISILMGKDSVNARKSVIIANNFKMMKLNGVYKIHHERRANRPMFRNPRGLVLWFSEVETWMISQEHLIGTDKSYAFVRDLATHPLDISNPWNTFNKNTRSWDSDPGFITKLTDHKTGEDHDDDHLSLAALMAKNHVQRPITKEVESDTVSWKVTLHGFKLEKLNSEYVCMKDESSNYAHFISPTGLVLWWYSRRKLWMVSPERLVGTDKSYACVVDECTHPACISGVWQVYDKIEKKFLKDEGGNVHGGRAEKVSLRGFIGQPGMNGIFIETRIWLGQRPTFEKLGKRTLVLFYRNSTNKWYVRQKGKTASIPIAACDVDVVDRAVSSKSAKF